MGVAGGRRVSSADVVWGGLLAAGSVVEVWALRSGRPDATLSASTRRWFRVATPPGRAVFAGAWCGFAVWFLVHILRSASGSLSAGPPDDAGRSARMNGQ